MKSTLLRSAPAAGLVALALMVSAGSGAVAAGLITGAQIKDGTVTTADVKDHTLKVRDFSSTTKAALKGAKGDPGPAGAVRAFGQVSGTVVTHQSGGVTVTNPVGGLFCIRIPNVDAATTVAVVTPNFSADDTFTGTNTAEAMVEYGAFGNLCPTATDISVTTFDRTYDSTTHDTTLTKKNEAFSFLVP
jgi:hypothetical protein